MSREVVLLEEEKSYIGTILICFVIVFIVMLLLTQTLWISSVFAVLGGLALSQVLVSTTKEKDKVQAQQVAQRKQETEAFEKTLAEKKEYIHKNIPDMMNQLLKKNKSYSFSVSKTLQDYVQKKQYTPFDRQVVIQKIDQEHESFKKFLFSRKKEMLEVLQTPEEYCNHELEILEKLKSYHQDFIQELLEINTLGITDPVERLYKKKIAEQDYNDIRNTHFSSLEELTTLFFESKTQDDELTPVSEVSNDEFY